MAETSTRLHSYSRTVTFMPSRSHGFTLLHLNQKHITLFRVICFCLNSLARTNNLHLFAPTFTCIHSSSSVCALTHLHFSHLYAFIFTWVCTHIHLYALIFTFTHSPSLVRTHIHWLAQSLRSRPDPIFVKSLLCSYEMT